MLIGTKNLMNKALRMYEESEGMMTEEEQSQLATKFHYYQVLASPDQQREDDLCRRIEMSFSNQSYTDEEYAGGEAEGDKTKKPSSKPCCGLFAMCGAKTRNNKSQER